MTRKSGNLPLRILTTMAEALRGPSELRESRYCVDEDGTIVPNSFCENSQLGTRYHWIYGGSTRGQMGDAVEGGSRQPTVHNPGFGFRQKGGS
jgi:hypothetical protein